jgi:putative ABC transport system ATP-binding protein
MNEIVSVEAVTRRFAMNHDGKHNLVSALNEASVHVQAGEFLAISGPSGSGKTTLLNLIGCIDQPTSGRVLVDGVDTSKLSPGRMALLRREKIGFVFQTFNLIPVFTAAENVEFPLLIGGMSGRERSERVAEALDAVGLTARAGHRPDLLSGGERQRVAVARAIVHHPALVMADEPTANLDTYNATQLIDLMHGLNSRLGLTFIFSTHDARLLEHTDRIVRLCDGGIQSDSQTRLSSQIEVGGETQLGNLNEGGIRGQVLASSIS